MFTGDTSNFALFAVYPEGFRADTESHAVYGFHTGTPLPPREHASHGRAARRSIGRTAQPPRRRVSLSGPGSFFRIYSRRLCGLVDAHETWLWVEPDARRKKERKKENKNCSNSQGETHVCLVLSSAVCITDQASTQTDYLLFEVQQWTLLVLLEANLFRQVGRFMGRHLNYHENASREPCPRCFCRHLAPLCRSTRGVRVAQCPQD